MNVSHDEKIKKIYKDKHNIDKLFDTPDLKFVLFKYEKDELISSDINGEQYILFVVKGGLKVFNVREDGTLSGINRGEEFTMIGDVEFVDPMSLPTYVEAADEVLCLGLSLKRYGEVLRKDVTFLNYLTQSLVKKIHWSIFFNQGVSNFEEKLIFYVKHRYSGGIIKGTDTLADQIGCSRRQLQRILKKLVEQEKVEKISKGCYQFKEL